MMNTGFAYFAKNLVLGFVEVFGCAKETSVIVQRPPSFYENILKLNMEFCFLCEKTDVIKHMPKPK